MDADLISIQEASKLTGKSQQTIRRWKRDGKINFVSIKGEQKAYLSRSSILTLVGQSSNPIQNTVHIDTQADTLNILRSYLEDTKRERDGLRMELKELRLVLEDKQERIVALERELNGGVRGLLRNLRRR